MTRQRPQPPGRRPEHRPPQPARSAPPEPQSPRPAAEATPPAGTLIVPLDAREKTLLQLGHLHEAGQQLADARARAAKAETEAHFLRERVSELRAELRTAPTADPPRTSAGTGPDPGAREAEVAPPPPSTLRWRWLRRRPRVADDN